MPSARASLHLPVMLLPLVGGVAGLAFGIIFGYVTTNVPARRSR